jgi:NADH-quinone oxidoreductase subunit L
MIQLAALIPLFPLFGFLFNAFFGKKVSKGVSGGVAALAILASFVVAVFVFIGLQASPEKTHVIYLHDWISSGSLEIPFQFLVDPLSAVFLLIITGIGFLIHVYSIGYMHDDVHFSRFFAYLNLFVVFMLLLVLGNNYLIMFVGWEGVGLASYLLIGFWFKVDVNNDAARKAFVMNRIGDYGFILGVILIFVTYGSITFGEVFPVAGTGPDGVITAIALLLFIGAMGKSAQIPLYTWLPDAMAGPTPVSALIHAATMVTAGIYMITRSNVFYSLSEVASETVAIIGVITALFAASIALFQNDIKKILAYSTVSQLGLMFLGLGVGAFSSSVFHVTTHAFFKALLFLAAGSVIHAMSGEQDIRKMGGLKGKIKITFVTMFIGTIAISGIPPFSGFFSKDEILAHAFHHNMFYWFLALVASMLTTFYMFRLVYLTFYGKFRGSKEQEHHLHESPSIMTFPLIALAVLSVAGGVLGLPEFWHMRNWMHENLDPVVIMDGHGALSHLTEWVLMAVAVIAAGIMIYIAYYIYRVRQELPKNSEVQLSPGQRMIYNKYYVDEIYDALFRKPIDFLGSVFYKVMELQVMDGIVKGIGQAVTGIGSVVRLAQTGNVGIYFISMVMGIILIVLLTFILV